MSTRQFFLTAHALSLLIFIKLSPANRVPTLLPNVWDNLNGTAGEPLSSYDIYLVDENKFRISMQFEPLSTISYFDSNGTRHNQSAWAIDYYRVNMPISIQYGIQRLGEVELRIPYVIRRSSADPIGFYPDINTKGLGDLSFRLRTNVYGEKEKWIYLALGAGIKFPTAKESEYEPYLPLSYGTLDFFFGVYNAYRIDERITLPVVLTYSHTGRDRYNDPVGELITYRLGLVANLLTKTFTFIDLNLGLKGYEITKGNSPGYPSQDISKTSADVGLAIRFTDRLVNLFGGVITDLRGKKVYFGTAPTFSLQIEF